MNIGLKIRTIRNKKNITIAQMCEKTGLSKGFISNIENNNTSPSIQTLQTIANFLEVPLPYLLLEEKQHIRVVRKKERGFSTFQSVKDRALNVARPIKNDECRNPTWSIYGKSPRS